ncbi:MAG: hypothetical protein MUP45_04120 [Candidatus Marinimicrobia bacterium]|nr:hypothetical protein [Candidatus Neomarinimicrobiota bacterium]
MIKRFFTVFCFIFLFFLAVTAILAQNEDKFDFNRANEDYLYTYGTYRQAHNEYVTAREQFLTYQTLTAKTLALEQTLNMLQKRDETLRTYLTALRMKMAETTGISNYKQNTHYLKLDAEVSWYVEHRDSLTSAGTLEDLVELSEEAEEEHGKTEVLSYQALGLILDGKEEFLKSQIGEQIHLLQEKLKEIKEKGDKDTTKAERWLLEAENKLTRCEEKLTEANQILEELKPSRGDKDKDYSEAQKLFSEAHLYLKEANGFLKELIREIKTAD